MHPKRPLRSDHPPRRASRRGRMAVAARLVMAVAIIALGTVTFAADDHGDAVFLRGLRQRQLFSLAERYCEIELAQTGVAPLRAAVLSEELIRTLYLHAANEESQRREPLWNRIREIAERLPRNTPRWHLVQTQAALAELAHAELARQEANIAIPAARDIALEAVRRAQRQLEELNKSLGLEIIERRRKPLNDPNYLSGEELFGLQAQIQYHLATAYLTRAKIYPPRADDQVAAIHSALEWCDKPLSQLSPDEPLVRKIRLQQATCQRLLGDLAGAKRILSSLLVATEADVKHGAISELAHLELDQSHPDRALAAVQVIPEGADPTVDLVRLEASLAMLKQAKSAKSADVEVQWRERAVLATKQIRKSHGAYWGRRADQMLIAAAGAGEAGGDLEIMRRQADDLAQRMQYPQALAAYDQAATQSAAQGDLTLAFQMRYKAALVAEKMGDTPEQAKRMRALSVELSSELDASKVHYYAIMLTVRLARSNPEQVAVYEAMLAEHAKLWPAGERTAQVLQWQGRLFEQRRDWPAAVKAYQASIQLAPEAAAIQGFERSVTEQLVGQDPSQSAVAPAQAASVLLESLFLENNQLPAQWSTARRAAALAAAQLYLRFVPASYSRVESILKGALNGTPQPDEAFSAEATPMLIVTLAAQPAKTTEAEALMDRLGNASPEQLLRTLDGLAKATNAATAESQAATAKLQLRTIDAMLKQPLSKPVKDRALRAQAEAFAIAGRQADALKAYRELADRDPTDGKLQLSFARFLSGMTPATRSTREAAIDQWRLVASHSRPRSDMWYEAKYRVAFLLSEQGDVAEAKKRLEYVRALHGFADRAEWQKAYNELLSRLK